MATPTDTPTGASDQVGFPWTDSRLCVVIDGMTAGRPRTCGTCSFCCKVMEVEELTKPLGEWCVHARGGKGCAVYGSHPPSCKEFACQWLLTPEMPHRFRPDLTKVVLTFDPDENRIVANCDPANPRAWRREPIYSMLKEQAAAVWEEGTTVFAKAGQHLWLLAPAEDVDLGDVDARSPCQIDRYPDGTARVEVLPPIPINEAVGEHLDALRSAAGLPSKRS